MSVERGERPERSGGAVDDVDEGAHDGAVVGRRVRSTAVERKPGRSARSGRKVAGDRGEAERSARRMRPERLRA